MMQLNGGHLLRFFALVVLTQAFVYVVVVLSTRYVGDAYSQDIKSRGDRKGRAWKKNQEESGARSLKSRRLISLAHEQLIGIDIGGLRDVLDKNILNDTVFDIVVRQNNDTSPFVMLTATNKDFINITENFLEGLRRLRLRYNVTLMAEDEETYSYFSRRSNSEFHVVSANQFVLPGKLNRNISSYQHLIRRRTVYILTLLRSGRDVLLVDVDAVWMKDPLAVIFPEYGKYDAWIAQGKEPGFPCPCFFYMKSVNRVINMVFDWIARVAYFEDGRPVTDQVALFNILEKNRRGVHMKYLDYDRFPIGKQYFNWTWHKENHNSVYVAHGNHLGREQGKIETFKEFGVWLLDT